MQLISKKLSQVYLVLFVSAFLTITGNFTFFEKTILVYPLSENWLFVGSLLIFLFTFLSAVLLLFCYGKTTKPRALDIAQDSFSGPREPGPMEPKEGPKGKGPYSLMDHQ